MNETDRDEDKRMAPAQQAQQPQPVRGAEGQGWPADADAALGKANLDGASLAIGLREGKQNPALDEARFTAGVVELYGTILKEPVPEKMLRLIDQLANLENKSGTQATQFQKGEQPVEKQERE